jgi:hypothetical protein
VRVAVYVMHVPGDPVRTAALEQLWRREPHADVVADPERKGAWATARRCWEKGLANGADWIIVLNDDALPCEDFREVATKALAARSPNDPVCFFTALPDAVHLLAGIDHWYTTHDDFIGVGCALHRDVIPEFLAWVDANPGVNDFTDDGRVNLWAMATRRLIYTTVPSLVDHQLPNQSMVGSRLDASDGPRLATVPPMVGMDRVDWTGRVAHFGRSRGGNHWELVHRVATPTPDLIEAAYLVARSGEPVSEKPHVLIATPTYSPAELGYLSSVRATMADLEAHGIEVTWMLTPGDSLVTRGRHCLQHVFLATTATHFLQWDADIECLEPTAVRKMLECGHDIVGGAYPRRDGSGCVVANPRFEDIRDRQSVPIDYQSGCIKVGEVGTGFLMVSRKAIVDLAARHPELLYMADLEPFRGAPMWALFDVAFEPYPEMPHRRRYASEDWHFCHLARKAGYDVHIYYPPKFVHWGKQGHQGHVIQAWGMEEARPS